jgi:hypothetical protein
MIQGIPSGLRGEDEETRARAYLRSILADPRYIDNLILGEHGPSEITLGDGWTYEPELGWVHCNAVLGGGVDRSRTFYSYEPDGARTPVNSAAGTARIHTYGDSFTHCDQVSDGETWQEYLAAHLQEPILNYGVGGYSVYQAYRRMRKVEATRPAEFILLNIWDDDHYRNLDAWRSIRFGRGSNVGVTLPHLGVNVAANLCEERENLLRTPRDLYNLADEQYVWEHFRNDPILKLVLASRADQFQSKELLEPVAVSFGIPEAHLSDSDITRRIRRIHTEAALFATQNVLRWTENFVKEAGKRLMVMLSFGRGNTASVLRGEPRFDQTLLDWLKTRSYPVIDMREAFKADFQRSRLDLDKYLDGYYNGHHTPRGNFFTGWAIKDRVVDWLEPKPLPYRG